MEHIPDIIKKIAAENGCNRVVYIGTHNNEKVFSISEVDEDGFPVPTGLPELLLWDGKAYRIIHGEESFKLLRLFD